MPFMPTRCLFIKKAEADREAARHFGRGIHFAVFIVAREKAAELSQFVQLGQKSLVDPDGVCFLGPEGGEFAKDPGK